jgi:cytochrome oxidase Cu insertion factor (SCO1/SenC/PrrC family)
MTLKKQTMRTAVSALLLAVALLAASCPRPQDAEPGGSASGSSSGGSTAQTDVPAAPDTPTGTQQAGGGFAGNAQDFEVETLDGKKMQLSALAAGKPVVVDFWAVW